MNLTTDLARRSALPVSRVADALPAALGCVRRTLGVEAATRRLLLGGVLPLWLGAGLARLVPP